MTHANRKRAMIDINNTVGLLRGCMADLPDPENQHNEHKQGIHIRRYTLRNTLRRKDNVVNKFQA